MGACSSRPKTAEFEGNMNFYTQEETATNNSDDDQKIGCDAGLKMMEPKTAEFEPSGNFYLQEEMARKSFEDDHKNGCSAGLKSIDPEQKISSLPNLQPGIMENEHGGMGVVLLVSEKHHLAGSSLENNRMETCARAEGTCHAKHNSVAEWEPRVRTDIVELQNEKKSVVQELYEDPAFTQKEDVLGSLRNSVLFEEEVVVELPQKVALKDAENGKFPTIDKTNKDKDVSSFEGGEPTIDAEEGNPASRRARPEPLFLASRVPNVDFKLKINSAGNLTNYRTENATACSASRAANGTMLLHTDKSGDLILEKLSKPEGLVYGAQRHDLEKALKASITQDSDWTNLNFMMTPSKGSLAVKENHVAYVIPPALIGLPEVSALSNGSLWVVGIKVDEFACIDISSSVLKSTGKGAEKKVKAAHMATSTCDELPCQLPKFTQLHAKDYERHSAASQPPQTFQAVRSIYGRDMASDIDEVLEKLASEFERQESLSSFLP